MARTRTGAVGALLVLAFTIAYGSTEGGAAETDTSEVAADVLALQTEIEGLEPTSRDRWPETFAGLWIDEHPDGVVEAIHVAFTENADEKLAVLAAGFSTPELLQAVTHKRSMRELEALQNRMIDDRERAKQGSASIQAVADGGYDLGIDTQANEVYVVVVDTSTNTEAAFDAAYGSDVRVEEGRLAVPTDCTRSACKYGLRSGLNVNSECSTAFAVTLPNGNENLLSAGHCGNVGSGCGTPDVGRLRFHDGESYGENREEKCGGRVDAERHGRQNPFAMRPWVYVNGENRAVGVWNDGDWEQLSVGSEVCKSGWTSGKSCGTVVDRNFSPNFVPNSNRFIKARHMCVRPGDSGAGVYRANNWHRALGIVSGARPEARVTPCSQWEPTYYSFFGHIEYARNALGVNVAHSSP